VFLDFPLNVRPALLNETLFKLRKQIAASGFKEHLKQLPPLCCRLLLFLQKIKQQLDFTCDLRRRSCFFCLNEIRQMSACQLLQEGLSKIFEAPVAGRDTEGGDGTCGNIQKRSTLTASPCR